MKLPHLILVAVVGLWLSGASHQLGAATHLVIIDGGAFEPQSLAIEVGDTVNWFAIEPDHTVTSDTGVFDSGEVWEAVPSGETFSHTFTGVGQFGYHCTVHGSPGGGMFGTIFVNAGSVNHPPNTPGNLLPGAGATNQPLTVQLVAGAFQDADALDFHAASQWIVRRVSNQQIVFDSGPDSVNKTNRTVPAGDLLEGTEYSWQVRYRDGRNEWSQYSAPTTFRTLVAVAANGVGLLGTYYNVANFVQPLAVVTNEMIQFDWAGVRPHRRITADNFGVRWEGAILPQYTETYRLQFEFRGRARVWVQNQLIIDEWDGCGFSQSRWGNIALVGGQLAALRIDYAAEAPGGLAVLRWVSPSRTAEVVPTNRLFPTSP